MNKSAPYRAEMDGNTYFSVKPDPKEKMKLLAVYHYPKGSMKRYWGIDLFLEGSLVAKYGDLDHDNGDTRVKGFMDCLGVLGHDFEYEEQHIDDLIGG